MLTLIRGLINFPTDHILGCVATIGNFDGVHLGHQTIIRELVNKSKTLGVPAVLITFEPQPHEFFSPPSLVPPRLMRLREKYRALQPLSLDYLLCLKFNQAFANLSPTTFIEQILVQRLKVKHLLVGDDFRFGHQRNGHIKTLENAGEKLGFTIAQLPEFKIGDHRVSSTKIRSALKVGDLKTAKILLGKDYQMSGQVSDGHKRGRMIGFPTANIYLHRKSVPLSGVYAVNISGIHSDISRVWHGVANIGTRPTVDGTTCLLEIHFFDFDQDIYGQHIQVSFIQKLRDEKKYDSWEALRQQILKDANEARNFFSGSV